MKRRDPVFMAWLVGLALAVVVYIVGPDRFLFRLQDSLHLFAWHVAEALADLSATALDAVRALSIGLFVTFLALAAAVARRGGRARLAAVVVSLLFLLLVQGPSPGNHSRWIAALALSGAGAAVMTGRLRKSGALARI